MKVPNVEIRHEDRVIQKITDFNFSSDITELCQTVGFVFPLGVEDLAPGFEFNPFSVWLEGKKIFTGWIDTLEQGEDNRMAIRARSLPSVLVDSQIFLDKVEYKNISFTDFIGKVCGRFNMNYSIPAGHRAFSTRQDVSYTPEDKAFSVLDNIATKNGFLLGSDNQGRLIVRDLQEKSTMKEAIEYIKDITYSVNLTKRFRNYQAKKDGNVFRRQDTEIKKICYLIKTKFEDSNIREELKHEEAVAKMSSRRVTITTPYLGRIYNVGEVVVIGGEELLISNVDFSVGGSGSIQRLGLVHADTFSAEENKIQLAYIRLRRIRAREREKERKEAEEQRKKKIREFGSLQTGYLDGQ